MSAAQSPSVVHGPGMHWLYVVLVQVDGGQYVFGAQA